MPYRFISRVAQEGNNARVMAYWRLKQAHELEYLNIATVADEETEPHKARYERLAVLRHRYPEEFEECVDKERADRLLPPRRRKPSIYERRNGQM